MKKLAAIFSVSLLLAACGNDNEKSVDQLIEEGNLSEIRARKSELSKEQSSITSDINRLDEEINKLDKNKNLNLVTTQKIADSTFAHYAEVQGDVATDENIIVYPEYSGILDRIYVQEGDKVNKGQVLAKIDDGGLSSQVAQSEAQATLAKTTYERQKRLWDQNIGSEIQYLEAKTNYEASQKAAEQLKSQLAKTTVTAPFSGVIDEIISNQGEVVSPGQSQLLRIINLSNMYVEAAVPENYLSKIQKGTSVKVMISSVGQNYEGKVTEVGNNINPANRTFRVKIAIPNPDRLIKPNQIATILLNDYTAEGAITIPENTVQKNSLGESVVYTLESKTDSTGVAKKNIIKTGYVYNNKIEVTEGLEAGATLIVEGSKSLRDGQEVKISKN
ncbi:efflux RND transporter periplasmic adaptor subunit [Zunongwangia endophytica]|uniref:Efflux RND transporter periplasmic adaptor subunit n=1 Tax=Zunongwangia endophytica TaxID=1808945 RepID=A0ABV8H7T4_9FLAO|nr:efflux RND transporter periplasmic adaptor subunit [Zunongwangia endophytica]MDN3595691.1 efflux RND transporter periplasmic adaptor subunit [Zunongwangia endophytica]